MFALTLLFVALGVLKTPTTSAQARTCSLILNVATPKNHELQPVNGARAIAVRNRRTIPAFLVAGQPRFSNLRAGHYQIAVTKSGFERAVQPLDLTCERTGGIGITNIEIEPGNFRRSVVAKSKAIDAPIRGVTTVIGSGGSEPASDKSVEKKYTPPFTIPKNPIGGGVVNGKALFLPQPAYPPIARQAHASGVVTVQVTIDENGNVISAHVISGHPLLHAVSVKAARSAKFSPTRLVGQPVKVTGVITYNFVAQ